METDTTGSDPKAVAEAQPDARPTSPAPSDAKPKEAPHLVHARRFWILSLVNWAIAIVCFGLSSYLGVARPTNMFVYTILFVVAMVAVIVGFLCWMVAKFGTEVEPAGGAR